MKIKKLANLRPVALVAIGVFLGRGAQADTTLTFDSDAASCTPPQLENPNNPPGITAFGDYAAASSGGVTVSGFGTPNIHLGWGGIPSPHTRWEYYNNPTTPWAGVVQLQGSFVGSTEDLAFIPDSASASVTIKSFSFFPYYNDNERFTYKVSVVSGTNVLNGPQTVTYLSDATNHLVSVNYTGAPGQTLRLQLARVASTLGAGEVEGNEYNNAADDIKFAQTPATTFADGPQVDSVTPANDTSGLPATSAPAYSATITNGPTLTAAAPFQLKLDYAPVSPPPTITPLGGGQTSVTYPGASVLLSSGSHVYTLTYADNLGAFYTNETVFSTIYSTLPAAYALPRGAGLTNGFTYRSVSASDQVDLPTNTLPSTIARAIAQLNGTLTNPATSGPFTNEATLGPNPDGGFNVDTVLNFNDNGTGAGNFPNDDPFPGLDLLTSPHHWFSTEALLYLDLPTGYYRFGVNSDDGFEVNALPPQGISGSPIQLGVFDNGRGAADTLFDVYVPTSGIYPFQLIYFQSAQLASCEFFSVTNFTTGGKVLINDPTDPNAIPSYRVLKPRITGIVRNGSNAAVSWAYGTPPFQVQFKTNITDAVWNNSGAPTSNRSANVPIAPNTGFIRVFGQ